MTRVRLTNFFYLADPAIGTALHEILNVIYRRFNGLATEVKEVSSRMDRFEGVEFGPPRVRIEWKKLAKLRDTTA